MLNECNNVHDINEVMFVSVVRKGWRGNGSIGSATDPRLRRAGKGGGGLVS